jgi:hypothetical protein
LHLEDWGSQLRAELKKYVSMFGGTHAYEPVRINRASRAGKDVRAWPPNPQWVQRALQEVGGLEIAAIAGAVIEAASVSCSRFLVLDNVIPCDLVVKSQT